MSSLASLFSTATQDTLNASRTAHTAGFADKLALEGSAKRTSHDKLVKKLSTNAVDTAADLVRDQGVCVLSDCIDPEFISNELHPASCSIETEVSSKLTSSNIPFRATPAVAPLITSSSFSYSEVSSRCLGRLDVRHKTSHTPFNSPTLVDNPALNTLITQLLGDDAELMYKGLIFSYPGSPDQPFHMDGVPLFPSDSTTGDSTTGPPSANLPPYALNIFIPLHPLTPSHGLTQFFPASHLAPPTSPLHTDIPRALRTLPTISPNIAPGSALVYDYRTVHRGTANTTNSGPSAGETRTMLYLMYARPWFKEHLNFGPTQLFDPYPGVPPDRIELMLRLEGIKDCDNVSGNRPVRFHCSTPVATGAPPAGSVRKRVHFMRHGQGVHNVYIEARKSEKREHGVKLGEAHTAPHLVDPVLTSLGEREAIEAREVTGKLTPTLIVVSPLRRATQTAKLAFEGRWGVEGVKVVAHELCREGYGSGNVYDMRCPKEVIQTEYPEIDYGGVENNAAGEDRMFVAGETDAGLVKRAYDFMCWLGEREEEEIAVVCHSKFLFALMSGAIETEERRLRGWFGTGEVRTVDCFVVKQG